MFALLFIKKWISARFVIVFSRAHYPTSTRKHACTRLKIALTCVTKIQSFCKPSSQEMRAGFISTIRIRYGKQWNNVFHGFLRLKKGCLQKSRIKTLLIMLFNSNGMIYPERANCQCRILGNCFEAFTAAHLICSSIVHGIVHDTVYDIQLFCACGIYKIKDINIRSITTRKKMFVGDL